MSTVDRAWRWARPSLPATRTLALVGLATLLGSVLLVLRDIVDVSGDLSTFYLFAGVAAVAATVLARVLRVAVALVLAAVALAVGLAVYVVSLPYDPAVAAMVESNVELLSGQSLLEIERSTVWALSVTPTPVFVTWYLGLRGWYGSAAAVAGGMLGYLVLTGDASLSVTLFGVVGAAAALGFGDLHRRNASVRDAETVAVVLAVMVLTPALVSVVPGGSGAAVGLAGGDGGENTIEASLLTPESSFDVAGTIDLSPAVRFRVTSPESRYWRVGSYNRYTGEGWVRSGESTAYREDVLSSPPGRSRLLQQTFSVESSTSIMPAAWRPVEVGSAVANRTSVREAGGLEREGPFLPGDSYSVISAVPVASPGDLSGPVGADPPELAERYTQLPASTPDRVARRTANLVGADATRYEAARRIQQWLQTNREYSLEVEKPSGNIADAFLFEMERGYCTYYATTMVTMLRTQDIPARLVVGYTPGEEVEDDEYVVRGLNSHAWVEVYFPETGWVQFDPTPAEPRQEAEQERIDEFESSSETGSTATPGGTPTPDGTATPTATPTPNRPTPLGGTPTPPDGPQNGSGADDDGEGGIQLPELPSTDRLALGAIAFVGLAAGVRRSRLAERAYRFAWLRYQPRAEPRTDVERSWQRVAYLLERRHRPRRTGETVRGYLSAVDAGPLVRRVARLRERAAYGDDATEAMADEARSLVERIRRQS